MFLFGGCPKKTKTITCTIIDNFFCNVFLLDIVCLARKADYLADVCCLSEEAGRSDGQYPHRTPRHTHTRFRQVKGSQAEPASPLQRPFVWTGLPYSVSVV